MALEEFAAAVEHADSRGPQHLVTGERGIVDVEGVKVDGLMRYRLAGVQHRQRTDRLGAGDQFLDRRDGAGDVRVMTEGNDFHPLVELERIEIEMAVVGHPVPAQRGPGAAGQFLPWDQIGVVFQLGGDDHVARSDCPLEAVVTQRIGHQVDRLGGVLREDQFVGIGTDEGGDVGPAVLVGVGRLLHQLVCATMHPAVGRAEELPLGVEHLKRLL